MGLFSSSGSSLLQNSKHSRVGNVIFVRWRNDRHRFVKRGPLLAIANAKSNFLVVHVFFVETFSWEGVKSIISFILGTKPDSDNIIKIIYLHLQTTYLLNLSFNKLIFFKCS